MEKFSIKLFSKNIFDKLFSKNVFEIGNSRFPKYSFY